MWTSYKNRSTGIIITAMHYMASFSQIKELQELGVDIEPHDDWREIHITSGNKHFICRYCDYITRTRNRIAVIDQTTFKRLYK